MARKDYAAPNESRARQAGRRSAKNTVQRLGIQPEQLEHFAAAWRDEAGMQSFWQAQERYVREHGLLSPEQAEELSDI
jgi:hypothetical protein